MLSSNRKSNFEKVTKYTYRLKKAFQQQSKSKSSEYLKHLKHHIQKGGFDEAELEGKFQMLDRIIQKINSDPDLKIGTIRGQLVELQGRHELLEQERGGLIAQLATVQAEKQASTDRIAQLTDEIKMQTQLIARMNAQEVQYKERIVELQALIDDLKRQINDPGPGHPDPDPNILNQIKELQAEVNRLNDQVINLLGQVAQLEQNVAQLEQEVVQLQSQVAQLTREVADLQTENQDLRGQLLDLTRHIRQLEAELVESRRANGRLEEVLKSSSERLDLQLTTLLEAIYGPADAQRILGAGSSINPDAGSDAGPDASSARGTVVQQASRQVNQQVNQQEGLDVGPELQQMKNESVAQSSTPPASATVRDKDSERIFNPMKDTTKYGDNELTFPRYDSLERTADAYGNFMTTQISDQNKKERVKNQKKQEFIDNFNNAMQTMNFTKFFCTGKKPASECYFDNGTPQNFKS